MPSGLYRHRRVRPQRLSRRIMQPPQAPMPVDIAVASTFDVDGNDVIVTFDRSLRLAGQPVIGNDIPNGLFFDGATPTTIVATQTTPITITLTLDVNAEAVTDVWLSQPCDWLRTTTGGYCVAAHVILA